MKPANENIRQLMAAKAKIMAKAAAWRQPAAGAIESCQHQNGENQRNRRQRRGRGVRSMKMAAAKAKPEMWRNGMAYGGMAMA
jgi:hypothetical protein